ncbi:MAG TPA: Wzz/FepE/Etk N-terminal domain-containing protein, partial [Candidatus Hydrogenedentes bacterium]|nr:Wzz/FepE/Etk N-terminal domain-containing protein [Candidatus Hydrogenedentota bacterium]
MDQRQFFVRDVLTVIFKRIKLILFLPILIFAVVFVGNYLWPPTYESMAKVRLVRGREVSQTDPTVTSSGQDMTMISLTVEDLNSEIELVHSRDLLETVVRDMKLEEHPDFPYGSGPLRAPFLATRAFVATLLDILQIRKKPDGTELAMQQLNEALIVEPVRDSYVLEMRCRLGSPALARQVLEKAVEVFKSRHIDVFRTPESSGFFEQKKRQTREALDRAEKEMLE